MRRKSRLDADAICLALGGTCVNQACCTTPFSGLKAGGGSGNERPLTTVDGDVEEGSIISVTSAEEREAAEIKSGLIGSGTAEKRTKAPSFGTTPEPYTERPHRTTTRRGNTKKVSVVTLKPEGPEMEELFEILGNTTQATVTTKKKTKKGKKSSQIETTTALPEHVSLLLTTCGSGLRPVGPCSEDSDCPALHHCQNGKICCYNVFHDPDTTSVDLITA
ncbi:unnamed protein product, partial [Mesorhabditis spiculigera]